jgi:hypothetical protein
MNWAKCVIETNILMKNNDNGGIESDLMRGMCNWTSSTSRRQAQVRPPPGLAMPPPGDFTFHNMIGRNKPTKIIVCHVRQPDAIFLIFSIND